MIETIVTLLICLAVVEFIIIVMTMRISSDQLEEIIELQWELQQYKLFNPKLWESESHGHEQHDNT